MRDADWDFWEKRARPNRGYLAVGVFPMWRRFGGSRAKWNSQIEGEWQARRVRWILAGIEISRALP